MRRARHRARLGRSPSTTLRMKRVGACGGSGDVPLAISERREVGFGARSRQGAEVQLARGVQGTRHAQTFAVGACLRPSAMKANAEPTTVSPTAGERFGSVTLTPAGHHDGS